MNFILTKMCNKGCPYCFAHESRIEDPKAVMTLDTFKALYNKYCKNEGDWAEVRLLGGEPTCHPQFKEIADFLVEERKGFLLISNFLFSQEILEVLLHAMEYVEVNFLINATDLDVGNRKEIWVRNYKAIYNFLYKKDREEHMSAGITLDQNKTKEYYIEYLDDLFNTVKVERLRISLNFPGSIECKNPYEYINNYDAGEKLLYIIQLCIENGIIPSLDCNIYPCMFKDKEQLKYISRFLKTFSGPKRIYNCSDDCLPMDVGPDASTWACYPLKKWVSIPNILDDHYKNPIEIEKHLSTQKRILREVIRDQIPAPCKHCDFFKDGICEGPSLCHYNFDKMGIEIPKYLS